MARLSTASAFGLVIALFFSQTQATGTGCNADNVLRALRRFSSQASPFCATFIQSTATVTVTPTSIVPGTVYESITVQGPTETSVIESTDVSTATETTTSTSLTIFPTTLITSTISTTASTLTVISTTTVNYQNIPNPIRRDAESPLPSYVSQYPASRVSSACSCLGGPISTITSTATAAPAFSTSLSTITDVSSSETTTTTTSITSVTTTETASTLTITTSTSITTTTALTAVPTATQTLVCNYCDPAQQVIGNPSFEDVASPGSTAPAIWSTYNQAGTTISDVSTNNAVSGSRAIQISRRTLVSNDPSYPHVNLAQTVRLCHDATYTLTYFIGVDTTAITAKTGYVNSEYVVTLGGNVIAAKAAVCAGDASDCTYAKGNISYRKVTVSNITPPSCDPELLFMVYFKKSTKVVPNVYIDLVGMTVSQ